MSTNKPMPRQTFYIRDISELCGVSNEAVRQWCRSGKLKNSLIDRTYYISFVDLVDHFMNNKRHLNLLYNAEPDRNSIQELKSRIVSEVTRRMGIIKNFGG